MITDTFIQIPHDEKKDIDHGTTRLRKDKNSLAHVSIVRILGRS